MLAMKIYLWSHFGLAFAVAATGLRRYVRRDAFALFGDDVLRLLLAFMVLGGAAVVFVQQAG
ncbi:hypothetical protein [Arenibaculum sp.]|uniref:hypothetical protein n=1 Tax=Arenibaculum sp. TaxID=2865862 RepID=UPI002E13C194|nr:hypothetical protein [Arenibaculum sp.]